MRVCILKQMQRRISKSYRNAHALILLSVLSSSFNLQNNPREVLYSSPIIHFINYSNNCFSRGIYLLAHCHMGDLRTIWTGPEQCQQSTWQFPTPLTRTSSACHSFLHPLQVVLKIDLFYNYLGDN